MEKIYRMPISPTLLSFFVHCCWLDRSRESNQLVWRNKQIPEYPLSYTDSFCHYFHLISICSSNTAKMFNNISAATVPSVEMSRNGLNWGHTFPTSNNQIPTTPAVQTEILLSRYQRVLRSHPDRLLYHVRTQNPHQFCK